MPSVKRVNPKVIRAGNIGSDERRALYAFGEGGFTVLSHALLQSIADGEFSGEALRVLACAMVSAKRANRVELSQAKIAERLGMWPSHVSRAWRELREAGVLIRVTEPGGLSFWYIDARRAFRGAAASHPAALERQSRQRERDRRANVVCIAA